MIWSTFSLLSSLLVGVALAEIDPTTFPKDRIITKQVAIIGGGASGTYASILLRSDYNASIVLIEQKDHLGGHVGTYTIPGTNTTIEYGVQSYIRYGGAADFFARFGISITPNVQRRLTSVNVDIETGKVLAGYTAPSLNDTTEALQRWLVLVEKYETILEPGYWNFPAPDAIPSDLLVPFGEFARTHGLEAAVPRIMAVSNVGIGGIEGTLTIYVMQAFGAPITRGMLATASNGLFIPVGSNSLLYQRAYEVLKEDVLLSSFVKESERTEQGVRLVVQAQDGDYLIEAKRLLFTPPPSLAPNLAYFDIEDQEREVFRTWTPTWSFIGVVKIPCIPQNYSIAYIAPEAVSSGGVNQLAIRNFPYTLRIDSTGPPGMDNAFFRVLFATNYSITADEAKQTVSESVQKIVAAGTVNYTGDCNLDFLAFTNHNSILWRQTAEQLKGGFVQQLNNLQGQRSTWYTGSLWTADYSSNVWAFTDTVLSKLVKGLK